MKRESIILLTTVLALVLIGLVIVYSASAAYSLADARLAKHLVFIAIGLAALYIGIRLDYHRLADPLLFRFLVLLSLTLLIAVLIPGIGVIRGGAQRWIEIGGFQFQPSEFAKFALILLLAVKLSQNRDTVTSFSRGFAPCALIVFLFAFLVLLERDLGTPVVLCVAAFIMLVIGGVPWKFLIPSVFPAGIAVYALAISSDYRMRRLTAFMDPWSHRQEEGYQLIQSMTAFVKGSVWGLGPGGGEQKLFYLPEAHTDFIFAVWGEETGLMGSLFLLTLFAVLLSTALRVAMHADDLFGTLLAGGIVSLIAFQASFNMSVATGLLPTKGLPLPFVSMGGTSLIVFMGLMGIVINIGLQAEEPRRVAHAVPA